MAPRISPARGPPLWEGCDAQMGEGVEIEPDWGLAAQPAPHYEVDQRINWRQGATAIQTRCGLALRLACPVHPRPLIRAAHFGGEPAKQGVTAGQVRKFMTIDGCSTAAILPLMGLKFLSVSAS